MDYLPSDGRVYFCLISVSWKKCVNFKYFLTFLPDHATLRCRKCITDVEAEEYTSFTTQVWVSWPWNNGFRNRQEPSQLWPLSHCVEQVT